MLNYQKRIYNCFKFLILLGIIKIVFLKEDCKTQNNNVLCKKCNTTNEKTADVNELKLSTNADLKLPYFSTDFMEKNQNNISTKYNNCAKYPKISDIKFHKILWQYYNNRNVSFYLYGAYYDTRSILNGKPLVRVLAMINQIKLPFPPSFCQIWYNEMPVPIIVPVKNYLENWIWDHLPKLIYPHFVNCELPQNFTHNWIPQTVSLVTNKCQMATNNLKINYDLPEKNQKKNGFVVCVKNVQIPFADRSPRLIEWLELLKMLGVSKVFIYALDLYANIGGTLNYNEKTGFVKVLPITYALGKHLKTKRTAELDELYINNLSNKRLHEIVSLNDCFYRNMYKYNYVAVLDFDEIIMPLKNLTTWFDIIKEAKQSIKREGCKSFSSYCFKNVYYPEHKNYTLDSKDIPDSMYMMQHVYRTAEHLDPNYASKCFHDTNYCLALHNHFAIHWLESCAPAPFNETLGQLQHYREPDNKTTLDTLIFDGNIWRFKEKLINQTLTVYKELQIMN